VNPSVTVVGCPEELTLHAFGRDHAIVDISKVIRWP
jgi:hypothetical protein